MSSVNFYSIKDVHIGHFTPPFLARDDFEAKALVRDSIEPGSTLSRYPSDYHLYRVGIMDSLKGIISNDLYCVCSIGDLIRPNIGTLSACDIGGVDDE